MANIFVTGVGIISAIGCNIKETLDSIFLSKSGLSKISILETNHNDFFVGEIKYTNQQLEKKLYNSAKNYSRTTLLGMIAAAKAVENANIKNINNIKTGLISATTVGGMDKTETFYNTFKDLKFYDFILAHHCGDSTEKIADFIGIKNFTSTLSTACSSSTNSII